MNVQVRNRLNGKIVTAGQGTVLRPDKEWYLYLGTPPGSPGGGTGCDYAAAAS